MSRDRPSDAGRLLVRPLPCVHVAWCACRGVHVAVCVSRVHVAVCIYRGVHVAVCMSCCVDVRVRGVQEEEEQLYGFAVRVCAVV